MLSGSIAKSHESDIAVIQRYVQDLRRPVSIDALLCWEDDQLLRFLRKICSSIQNPTVKCGVFEMSEQNLPSGKDAALIVVDLKCDKTVEFFKRIHLKKYQGMNWLVLNVKDEDEEEFLKILNTQNLGPSSEFTYIRRGDVDMELTKIYKVGKNYPLSSETYATWNGQNYSIKEKIRITSRRRQNLQRAQLRGSMVLLSNDTLNHLDDYRNTHVDSISKVSFLLTKHVAEYLNGTFEFSIVPSWGYRNHVSGIWDGMVGDLVSDAADIGVTPLFYTTDRIPWIDFIALVSPTKTYFVFRSPKLSYTDNVFMLPFTGLVWICVVSLIPIIGISLALVTYAEWKVPLQIHVSHSNFFANCVTKN